MFSAITFYWGSDANLYKYAKETSLYTDNIIIGYVDLFNKVPKIDGLNIIPFSHDFILKNGHAEILNQLDSVSKYDWTFHAAVGKKITDFNYNMLDCPSHIAGFASTEKDLGGAWSNLHNKQKAKWEKVVHEVIVPKEGYILSSDVAVEWQRTNYVYDNEAQEKISKAYRQMTRTKWVALKDNLHPGRDRAIEMYKKHEYAYNLNREDLLYYIINHDLESGM